MKCPHCKYVVGWDFDTNKSVEGGEGNFYTLSNDVKMYRGLSAYDRKLLTVLGCPNCKKVFMGDFW